MSLSFWLKHFIIDFDIMLWSSSNTILQLHGMSLTAAVVRMIRRQTSTPANKIAIFFSDFFTIGWFWVLTTKSVNWNIQYEISHEVVKHELSSAEVN